MIGIYQLHLEAALQQATASAEPHFLLTPKDDFTLLQCAELQDCHENATCLFDNETTEKVSEELKVVQSIHCRTNTPSVFMFARRWRFAMQDYTYPDNLAV